MRNMLLVAGLAGALMIPSLAAAQESCERAKHDNKVAGTVIGAIAGGLLGNAVSHGGGRAGGTAIGAVGGAVVGNQLARNGRPCPDGYVPRQDARDEGGGYYDRDGDYHAYADSRGWRDRDGRWCAWRDESYRADDGDYVRRMVKVCQ